MIANETAIQQSQKDMHVRKRIGDGIMAFKKGKNPI